MNMSGSIVEAWRERVAAGPDRAAIRYFDGTIDAATLDSLTDALATEFQARGVRSGDRIGIYLQNIPYYPLALLAVWKAARSPCRSIRCTAETNYGDWSRTPARRDHRRTRHR